MRLLWWSEVAIVECGCYGGLWLLWWSVLLVALVLLPCRKLGVFDDEYGLETCCM